MKPVTRGYKLWPWKERLQERFESFAWLSYNLDIKLLHTLETFYLSSFFSIHFKNFLLQLIVLKPSASLTCKLKNMKNEKKKSESGTRTGDEDWGEFKARQLRDAKEVVRFDFEQTSLPLLWINRYKKLRNWKSDLFAKRSASSLQ